MEETEAHLFLHCHQFSTIWPLIWNWIGVTYVDPSGVTDHLVQFTQLLGLSKVFRSLLQLIWFAAIWVIWKGINDTILLGKIRGVYWIKILRDFKRLFNYEKVLWYSIKTLCNLKKVWWYSIKTLCHSKKVLRYSIKTFHHLKKVSRYWKSFKFWRIVW